MRKVTEIYKSFRRILSSSDTNTFLYKFKGRQIIKNKTTTNKKTKEEEDEYQRIATRRGSSLPPCLPTFRYFPALRHFVTSLPSDISLPPCLPTLRYLPALRHFVTSLPIDTSLPPCLPTSRYLPLLVTIFIAFFLLFVSALI